MSRGLIALLLLSFVGPIAAAPTAEISDGKIVLTRLSALTGLNVVVAEGTEADIATRPPVTGEWTTADGAIVFTPKYPLRPGTRYRIVGPGVSLDVRVPTPPAAARTVVTHIHPTSGELPENVLRFYIEFNRSMPRGDVYQYVTLYNEAGIKDVQPFVELDAELWNADQTLLTLLIDPGRIKKEVKPRIDLGPVFRQGKKYSLVISGKWPTLDGTPLGEDLRKAITVVAPVADGIDPKTWKVTAPADETSPITVTFDRTMDRPILMRALAAFGPDGKAVAGCAESKDHDRQWVFQPRSRWASGAHTVRVQTILEDVSGNRLGRPFEIDLARPAPREVKEPVELPFTVGRR